MVAVKFSSFRKKSKSLLTSRDCPFFPFSDYLEGDDLRAGGTLSPSAINGTPLRGATEKGGGSNSCACLRGNFLPWSTDGDETSQREKENKANHSPQREGPERRNNDDGNEYEDEDGKETRKKSLTGLSTIKIGRKKSLSFTRRMTNQSNGSGEVGVPPFPMMENTSAQKRKKSGVGDEEESMTSMKRMKVHPPVSIVL